MIETNKTGVWGGSLGAIPRKREFVKSVVSECVGVGKGGHKQSQTGVASA